MFIFRFSRPDALRFKNKTVFHYDLLAIRSYSLRSLKKQLCCSVLLFKGAGARGAEGAAGAFFLYVGSANPALVAREVGATS